MKVVACFRLVEKNERFNDSSDPNPVDVRFVPAYDDNGPNKSWSKWTPSGELKMTITNPAASAALELGEHYLLTFEKATPEQVHPPKAGA